MNTLIDKRPKAKSAGSSEANEGFRSQLTDSFQRPITYLRLSVTDRCDLRCTYCMSEDMTFLPKSDVLSFEEIIKIVDVFISRGVRKLRVTGGEPLVRRGIMNLLRTLSTRLDRPDGLSELTLTTNGTQLTKYADDLAQIGIKRINVSLDTLKRDVFARLTRRDGLDLVLDGIAAASKAGIKVKLNTVALADENGDELPDIISWAHERGHDVSLIEVMPMGEGVTGRSSSFLSLQDVHKQLSQRWTLTEDDFSTGGPSRYHQVVETGGRIGFISPLSHNFCSTCNRIRITSTGQLYTCLGHEDGADLRAAIRGSDNGQKLMDTIDRAIGAKPERHDFDQARIDDPSSPRTMSVTGG